MRVQTMQCNVVNQFFVRCRSILNYLTLTHTHIKFVMICNAIIKIIAIQNANYIKISKKKINEFRKMSQKEYISNENDSHHEICSQCFMNITICMRIRFLYKNTWKLTNCDITNELFCYLYVFFHYHKELLSLQFTIFSNYEQTLKKYAIFLSNAYLYENTIKSNETTKLIENIRLN